MSTACTKGPALPALGAVRCASWIALAVGALACSSQGTPLRLYPKPGGEVPAATRITAPVTLVADSQIQHLFGSGAYARSGLADLLASTAVRPPQLDMFGPDLLRDAVCSVPGAHVIHLGDAGNGSCEQELSTFFDVMDHCPGALSEQRAGHDWVFTPGNHDGFFMGSGDVACDQAAWTSVCETAELTLTKNETVRKYVSRFTSDPPLEGDYQSSEGLLLAAHWHIEDERGLRQRSYVTQLLDLTSFDAARGAVPCLAKPNGRVLAVVMDSASYDEVPAVFPEERDAGRTGAIVSSQQGVVRQWVEGSPGSLFVLMSHHPIEQLTPSSRGFVQDLVAQHANVLLYVSAHTHAGWLQRHAFRESGLLELNLASVVDQPMEWRNFALYCDASHVFLSSDRRPSEVPSTCDPRWSEGLDYVGYHAHPGLDGTLVQQRLLQDQAITWIRLLDSVRLSDSALTRRLRDALSFHYADPDSRKLSDAVLTVACLEARDSENATPAACARVEPLPAITPDSEEIRVARLRLRADFKRCVAGYASKQEAYEGACSAGHSREALAPIAWLELAEWKRPGDSP